MSIDATVDYVIHNEDGSGRLVLKPRTKGGDNPGQPILLFDSSPHDVTALNGRMIWGDSGNIYYGDRTIAKRDGYTRIQFVVDEICR